MEQERQEGTTVEVAPDAVAVAIRDFGEAIDETRLEVEVSSAGQNLTEKLDLPEL